MADGAPPVQFDHLMHWVPDLRAAIQAYQALGFTVPDQTGRHPGGTENTSWRMGVTYIELITVADEDAARLRWGEEWPTIEETLRVGGGALRFAVLVPDVAAAVAAARAQGIDVGDPSTGRIQRADGSVASWTYAFVADGPPWRPFFINYGMSPSQWPARFRVMGFPRDPWTLDHLRIETPDPAGRAAWLGRVLGMEPEEYGNGMWQVPLAGCAFVLTPGDADRVTTVALTGPTPPVGEIAHLTYGPTGTG